MHQQKIIPQLVYLPGRNLHPAHEVVEIVWRFPVLLQGKNL